MVGGGVRWGGVRGLPTIWQAPRGPGVKAPEEAVASRCTYHAPASRSLAAARNTL
jgi:hypothetical protein